MDFQIPSQASLHGIVKTHCSFCYANSPALSLRDFLEKYGVALGESIGVEMYPKIP
jgi:hypothetical protein